MQKCLEMPINTGFRKKNAEKNTAEAVFFMFFAYHYILWFGLRYMTRALKMPLTIGIYNSAGTPYVFIVPFSQDAIYLHCTV